MKMRHAVPVRGLLDVSRSQSFEGRFGRMFRHHHATFGTTDHENLANLTALAQAMVSSADTPKDGPDSEESGIPALYTYFGQFIDHDLTFDPASSLQRQDDPAALTDFRTPAFDLDCVYGRGKDDQPYLYDDAGNTKPDGSFLLGNKITGGNANATDLPRNIPGRALIGDPRNDENTIVSQFQGLMLRFHNRVMRDNPGITFEDAQTQVRYHYQFVVLNDFLPRIVSASVLSGLKTGNHFDKSKIKFFKWRNNPFIPVEFSVAAYRLGHSMVRPGYRLNDDDKTLLPIFTPSGGDDGLTGFKTMNPTRGIDWGRMIDLDVRAYGSADPAQASSPTNKKRLQFAYRIDTSCVSPLGALPSAVVSAPSAANPNSLPARNLLRGWRMQLPSGQQVAHAMGLVPLPDDKILIGKAEDGAILPSITSISPVFTKNCPLWTYVLAEAIQHQVGMPIPASGGPATVNTPQLGPVGGRIVAEVFLGLMFASRASFLHSQPLWTPAMSNYRLKDFVAFALG